MAANNSLLATGITVTFSDLTADLVDIDGPSFLREFVDVTHQASGSWKEFKASPFSEGDEITLTMSLNGTVNGITLITSAAGTLAITMPTPVGGTSGAAWSMTASVTGFRQSGQLGQKMPLEVTFKPTGTPSFTAAI